MTLGLSCAAPLGVSSVRPLARSVAVPPPSAQLVLSFRLRARHRAPQSMGLLGARHT